jgi:hypothetical protein
LPARLGEVASEGRYHFDPLDYRHPLVSAFRGRERSGLLTTPISRYYRLLVPDAWKAGEKALAFDNNDPAIVAEKIQAGRSILVATCASLGTGDDRGASPWTLLPIWPSFVPLVHELVAAAAGSDWEAMNVQVGQSIGRVPSHGSHREQVTVETPGGRQERWHIQGGAQAAGNLSVPTRRSGIHRTWFDSEPAVVQHYAVNVDSAESDLSKVNRKDVPAPFVVTGGTRDVDMPAMGSADAAGEWHRALLYAALACLLVETWLQGLLGRVAHRSARRPVRIKSVLSGTKRWFQ